MHENFFVTNGHKTFKWLFSYFSARFYGYWPYYPFSDLFYSREALMDICFCFFSVCNRTLYGEVGRTYELQLQPYQLQHFQQKQQDVDNAHPFLCHLNFSAPGGIYGDIVQVKWTFNADLLLRKFLGPVLIFWTYFTKVTVKTTLS